MKINQSKSLIYGFLSQENHGALISAEHSLDSEGWDWLCVCFGWVHGVAKTHREPVSGYYVAMLLMQLSNCEDDQLPKVRGEKVQARAIHAPPAPNK